MFLLMPSSMILKNYDNFVIIKSPRKSRYWKENSAHIIVTVRDLLGSVYKRKRIQAVYVHMQ